MSEGAIPPNDNMSTADGPEKANTVPDGDDIVDVEFKGLGQMGQVTRVQTKWGLKHAVPSGARLGQGSSSDRGSLCSSGVYVPVSGLFASYSARLLHRDCDDRIHLYLPVPGSSVAFYDNQFFSKSMKTVIAE